MKLHSLFYALVLTPAWVICAVLAGLFPGGEHFNLLPTLLPGYLVLRCLPWTRSLLDGSVSAYAVPAVSVAVVLILASGMDWLRVRKIVWKRAVISAASIFAVIWVCIFLQVALEQRSFAGAAHKMDFDDINRLVCYPLFCLSSGLFLGSVIALLYGGIERILRRANHGASPNGGPPASADNSGAPNGPPSVS